MKIQDIYNKIDSEIREVMVERGFFGVDEDYLSYIKHTIYNETVEVAIIVNSETLAVRTIIEGESGGITVDGYDIIFDEQKFAEVLDEVA